MKQFVFRDPFFRTDRQVWDLFEKMLGEFEDRSAPSRATPVSKNFTGGDRQFVPQMDIEEKEGLYLISVDLPGVKDEDVEVRLVDGLLKISGRREKEVHGEGKYLERHYGEFSRSLTLPTEIKADGIEAQFESGVLKILLPKQKAEDSRVIKVAKKGEVLGLLDRWLGKGHSIEETNSRGEKKIEKGSADKDKGGSSH